MAITDVWQDAMNAAYENWADDQDYTEFLDNLDERTRKLVIVGNFNYQVQNGGLSQWIDNGYVVCYEEVAEELENIGFSEIAERMKGIVEKYINVPKTKNNRSEMYAFDEEDWDVFQNECDAFDTLYYEFDDRIVEAFAGQL